MKTIEVDDDLYKKLDEARGKMSWAQFMDMLQTVDWGESCDYYPDCHRRADFTFTYRDGFEAGDTDRCCEEHLAEKKKQLTKSYGKVHVFCAACMRPLSEKEQKLAIEKAKT